MGDQVIPDWSVQLNTYRMIAEAKRQGFEEALETSRSRAQHDPLRNFKVILMRPTIIEITRVIFLSLLDEWIQRLAIEVRQDIFLPPVASHCDDLAAEANFIWKATYKLENDLMSLDLDQASLGLLKQTLTTLQKKMQAELAASDTILDRIPRRKRTAANSDIDIPIYEKMLLGTDLQIERKVFQDGDHFTTTAASGRVRQLTEEFKLKSVSRVATVSAAYTVSRDRQVLWNYYFALMNQMIDQSKPSASIPAGIGSVLSGIGAQRSGPAPPERS